MRKALISPIEIRENGVRVAQVEDQQFEIASPLFWVDCPDEVTSEWTYLDGNFIEPPPPPPQEDELVIPENNTIG